MPRSRTSLAKLPAGKPGRRGGKESPKLSRQGVTGVLGPVRIELGVWTRDDWELEDRVRLIRRIGFTNIKQRKNKPVLKD